MIASVVPRGVGVLGRSVVLAEEAAGGVIPVGADDYLARLADRNGIAVGIDDIYVVERDGLAHRADPRGHADRVGYHDGCLGLAEALHDLQSGRLFELAEDLGVERLSRYRCVFDGGQVETGQILFDEHAVHGGRRAESRYMVLGEERQDLVGVEAVEVVDEYGGLVEPLSVELAPHGFRPSGVGNGEVEPVGVYAVPVTRGDEMAERVFVVVGCDLRVSGGAGGEEHEHELAAAG